MQSKVFLLLLFMALIVPMKAQQPSEQAPYLRFGVYGAAGIHRMVGSETEKFYGETSTRFYTKYPEINPQGTIGLNLQLGKAGSRFSGQLTAGFAMQYHHWSYDWEAFSIRYGRSEGTQKIAEHVLSSDFALRAKWTGRQSKPWSFAIGVFTGMRLLARSRSYVKLERGNIIQPQSISAPTGPLVQLARRLGGDRLAWEPFVEARFGLDRVVVWPLFRNANLYIGATFWLGE